MEPYAIAPTCRAGQSLWADEKVQVLTLRNPDTVESLIWDKLNEKLDRITMAWGR